jgi:N-acetylmuramoyl-L-alanine amidase
MEKFTNFEDFKNRVLGQSIDIDKAYGPQCVDLFNYFNYLYNDCYINCQPSGYAKSIAENKANNGILKYYKEVPINQMIKGTVVIWGNCKYAPLSHVGFIISDNGDGTFQCLAQNSPKPYVTISKAYYDGIIGCFTPNQLLTAQNEEKPANTDINQKDTDTLAREVIDGKYGDGEDRKLALGNRFDDVQRKVEEILANQRSLEQAQLKDRILLETKKVIRGDYGNGHDNRERAIGLGHEIYEKIRAQVTANCNAGLTNWNNIKLFEELL